MTKQNIVLHYTDGTDCTEGKNHVFDDYEGCVVPNFAHYGQGTGSI